MVKRLFKIILVLFSWDERLPNIKGTELCGVSLTANPKGATDLVKTQKQTWSPWTHSFDVILCLLYSIAFQFFYLLLGCPTTNSGSMARGQSHFPNVTHCLLFAVRPEGHRESYNNSVFFVNFIIGSTVSICDALDDLVPFVQLKEREKHPWWKAKDPRLIFEEHPLISRDKDYKKNLFSS